MKINATFLKLIIVIFAGFGFSQAVAQYCSTNGNTSDEWIERVNIGTFSNTSGNNNGYQDYTSRTVSLVQNQNYNLTLVPGYSGDSFDDYWRIWIDFDKDENFEPDELVFDLGNGRQGTVSANMAIPSNANLGTTRMRIAMKFVGTLEDNTIDNAPPVPCGNFNFGEVEDYTVNITESTNTTGYCNSSGNTVDEWIQQVSIGAFNFNSGNDGGYGNFTNQSVSLSQNQNYNLTLSPGYSGENFDEHWRIWIDFDKDENFETDELVFDTGSGKQGIINDNMTIPANAGLGSTRMRIAMKYIGTLEDNTLDDAPPVACGTFNFGEVEDYTVVINSENTGSGGSLPVAAFSSNITTGTPPLTVNFADESANNPTSWNWTFNGGNPASSNLENPTITYNEVGTYNVTLTVTNNNGTDTEVKTGYITVAETTSQAPVANFTSNATVGSAPLSVNFFDQSSNSPSSWSWTFAGGNPATSTLQNPVVEYNTPGTYEVSLTATNNNGTDIITKVGYITVTNQATQLPVPGFTANVTSGLAPLAITFQDLTTNNPNVWNWSFPGGNPTSSNSQNPIISYDTPGSYAVTLTVSNAAGTATETRAGYIIVNGVQPTANFSASVFEGEAPLSITFFDQSSGNPTNWEWSLAGATPPFSTEQNPTVTYNSAGTYQVSLQVTNDFGTDTRVINNYITVIEPTSIEELLSGKIIVGPTIGDGKFSVQATLKQLHPISLNLFNSNGQLISSKKMHTNHVYENFDYSHLPAGVYHLQIAAGKHQESYQLVFD